MGGRKVIVDLTYELLHNVLKLPKDVSVVGVWDYEVNDRRHFTDVFRVKLEGERFFEVPEGGMIPTVRAEISKVEWTFEEET